METKIKEYALLGLTNKEIANKLNEDEKYIQDYILNFSNPKKKQYNIKTYQDILMARNLRNKKVIDYDEIEEMIKKVFEGYTFLEIAIFYHKKENEIYDLFEQVLKNPYSIYVNKNLYNEILMKQKKTIENHWDEVYLRLQKLEEKVPLEEYCIPSSFTLKKFKREQKVTSLLKEYLDFHGSLTPQYLATKYHLEVYDVRNILLGITDRELAIKAIGEENLNKIRQDRLEHREQAKKDYTQSYQMMSNETKEKLNQFLKQQNFWVSFMLTFRLSYEDIARLTQYPQKYLYELKYTLNKDLEEEKKKALEYLEQEEKIEENYKKAKHFYYSMLLAMQTKNKNRSYFLNQLKDTEYFQLLNSKNKAEYTKEDFQIIIHYILKYALPLSSEYPLLLSYATENQKKDLQKLKEYQDHILTR